MQDQSTNTVPVQPALSASGGISWRSVSEPTSGWALAVTALAVCWTSLFYRLSGEWEINAQYSYGYVVPFLGAMLFWRRWPGRPPASPWNGTFLAFAGFALLFLLLPLMVVHEANPEWRLLYWSHAFIVLGLSFCLLGRAGGWSWMKYFSPPLLFMLIAVPWPVEWEQSIIQNLMRLVAGLTIQVAGWLGIPAVQHGNLIEVSTGIVGINEACSGIRSLQSGLMLSLFLGELNRFTASRRMVLVAASLFGVLIANVARTTFLTWAAASRGIHQMEAWHDTAGLLVMVFVLPALFILAHWLKPPVAAVVQKSPAPAGTLVLSPLPRWIAIGAFVWIGASELATEVWYRAHEQNLLRSAHWSVAWPVQEPHFKKTAIPAESLAILRCSQSDAALWKDDADNQWSAFFLRWDAGKNSVQLAKGHRPDICFPAAGAKLVDAYDHYLTANANGLELPFKYETFQAGDRLLHVFYCLWSDSVSPRENSRAGDNSWRWRLHAALNGERNLGQQVFEVVVSGPETSDAAISLFQQELPHLVRMD